MGLAVGAVALLLLAAPALAQQPDSPTFEIRLQVAEDGSWSIPSFGGVDLGLTSSNFAALSNRFNLGLAVPTIDTPTLQVVQEQDIQSLAVVKQGAKTTILVNNEPLSALTLGDEAIDAIGSFVPELVDMLGSVSQANVTVGLQFASAAGIPELDLTRSLEGALAGEAANTIDLGATVTPDGRVLSVGGLALEQLGLAPMQLDLSILQQFGVNNVQANVDGAGVTVMGNEAQWLRLDWNMDQVKSRAYTALPTFTGMALTDDTKQMVDVATDWLGQSVINVNAQVADESQESLPTVQLGRPVMVELTDDNRVVVEGIPLNVDLSSTIGPYRDQIDTIALKWDGARTRLYPVVNNQQLPYITMQSELVSTIGNTFVGGNLPWDELSGVLGNLGFDVGIMSQGGQAPDLSLAEYDAVPGRRMAMAVPKVTVSRADGSIAVNNAPMPLALVQNLFGVQVADTIRQQVQALTGVQTAEVVMGPAGVTAGVNGAEAYLVWDDDLRDNLVTVAMSILLADREIDLTPFKESGVGAVFPALRNLPRTLEVGMVRTLLDVLTQMDLGVEVDVQDDPLPPAFLDTFAAQLLPSTMASAQ
ncbi:MAG: hypothetical protein GX649_12770 [Chloroflexi bacterium]|nr:hypothetical protein [Chloroflexota bacterium]